MVRRKGRIYWRKQSAVRRAWGDFRDFADVGGKLEALRPPGAKLATTDPDIAAQLASDRVKDLETRRRNRTLLGVERQTTLGHYSTYHLIQKAESGKYSPHWLKGVERHLTEALVFFTDRDIATISTGDVQRYLAHLRKLTGRRATDRKQSSTGLDGVARIEWSGPATDLPEVRAVVFQGSARVARVSGAKPQDIQRRGRKRGPSAVLLSGFAEPEKEDKAGRDLQSANTAEFDTFLHLAPKKGELLVSVTGSAGEPVVGATVKWTLPIRKPIEPGTVRAYLNSLSNLYRRAASEGFVLPGYNPVAALIDKPVAQTKEARWLEVTDAARLLEAARVYVPPPGKSAYKHAHPLLASFLLTGGRKSEVLGLEVDDVSFDRRTVTFRPNQFRGLKSKSSHRVVTLWPQLEEILRAYVFGGSGPRGALLFPSLQSTGEVMLDNFDKTLAAIARAAGFPDGFVHLHMLRHTFCSARLTTLDRGHPVSTFVVGKELGHGGDALVRRIYGHVGTIQSRSEVVEYIAPGQLVTVTSSTNPQQL